MNEAAQASQGRSEMQDGSPVGSLAITSFSFLFQFSANGNLPIPLHVYYDKPRGSWTMVVWVYVFTSYFVFSH